MIQTAFNYSVQKLVKYKFKVEYKMKSIDSSL